MLEPRNILRRRYIRPQASWAFQATLTSDAKKDGGAFSPPGMGADSSPCHAWQMAPQLWRGSSACPFWAFTLSTVLIGCHVTLMTLQDRRHLRSLRPIPDARETLQCLRASRVLKPLRCTNVIFDSSTPIMRHAPQIDLLHRGNTIIRFLALQSQPMPGSCSRCLMCAQHATQFPRD